MQNVINIYHKKSSKFVSKNPGKIVTVKMHEASMSTPGQCLGPPAPSTQLSTAEPDFWTDPWVRWDSNCHITPARVTLSPTHSNFTLNLPKPEICTPSLLGGLRIRICNVRNCQGWRSGSVGFGSLKVGSGFLKVGSGFLKVGSGFLIVGSGIMESRG